MNAETRRSNAVDSLKDKLAGESAKGDNEWLAAVLSASRDGVVVETNERIVKANEACLRLLGYAEASELVGRPSTIFCSSPAEMELIKSGCERSLDASPEPFLFAARKKDGSLIQLEATARAAALDGRSHQIIILRPIATSTHLKPQKLEAREQVTDGVAHDLGNVFTAIRCQAELVLVYENVPATVREMMQKVVTSTERATTITRQLRAFSRLRPMQTTKVEVNVLISNLTKMIRRLLGEGLQLQLDCAANLPPIQADPTMLEQLILELTVNARAAMSNGGILTVSTSIFRADGDYLSRQPAARSGDFVALAVADSGCGMVPELLDRVCTAAHIARSDGSANDPGLAKVSDVIHQHQGWLDVDSRAGQGTCFRIHLPVRRDMVLSTAQSGSPQDPAVRGGAETLLVVTEDRELRWLIRLTLQKLGYEVLEAASVVEALEAWGNRVSDIRLVLTERSMPSGFDGCELIKGLRAEKPELKAIVMSDSASKKPEVELELLKTVGLLSKPLDPASLAQTIRRGLDETHG